MANRLLVNLRPPRNITAPTAVHGCGCEPRAGHLLPSAWRPTVICVGPSGCQRPCQTWHRASNLARQAKESERDLHRSNNLLCEQRRNRSQLPRGVGGQDANAIGRGSEAVVVVGVTSHRGARESRAQGEGLQNSTFQTHPRLAAVGRITKATREEVPYEQCRG